MKNLTDSIIILENKECPKDFQTIDFNLSYSRKYAKVNPALKIFFSNNPKINIACIKKLIYLKQNNLIFGTEYNGKTVKYVVQNANEEIFYALKAIEINDEKERLSYIYDKLCSQLDNIWKEKNPCHFCNNTCIANRENITPFKQNGCCYPFKYAQTFFNLLDETQSSIVCKYIKSGVRMYNTKYFLQNICV